VSPSIIFARLVVFLACICTVLVIGDPENFISDNRKIAFLFLVRGHVPLEDIWREFFNFKADPQHYSIYIHPHHGFKYPKTSFFHGKEIPNTQNVKWGGMTQVKAIKHLVREALKDPKNDWFTLMSETCIPVHPFPVWRTAFAKQTKSMFNACPMHPSEMETDTRWRPSLDKVRSFACVTKDVQITHH
jgi:Core-2/I-Branching enzyme